MHAAEAALAAELAAAAAERAALEADKAALESAVHKQQVRHTSCTACVRVCTCTRAHTDARIHKHASTHKHTRARAYHAHEHCSKMVERGGARVVLSPSAGKMCAYYIPNVRMYVCMYVCMYVRAHCDTRAPNTASHLRHLLVVAPQAGKQIGRQTGRLAVKQIGSLTWARAHPSCAHAPCPNPLVRAQEEFEMVRSALEHRMANLCASIREQESLIQGLQAEEARAKEANTALNVRA